jgi:hypothetical protein
VFVAICDVHGELVGMPTNPVMHFWLNEGFTVWAERRILEALRGAEASVLAWAGGEKKLKDGFERFGADSPLTKLRTELAGVDPDDVYSDIPYEKGSRFLALVEHTVGRRRFDLFVREYIARFRFTSITTEEFVDFQESRLPGTSERVQARRWLYEPGMPDNAPVFDSPALEELTALAGRWGEGARPAAPRCRVGTRTRCSFTSSACRARSTARHAPGWTRTCSSPAGATTRSWWSGSPSPRPRITSPCSRGCVRSLPTWGA